MRTGSSLAILAAFVAVGGVASPARASNDFPTAERETVYLGAASRRPVQIDGFLTEGEWEDADRRVVHMGEEHATLYVKNDRRHLYLALETDASGKAGAEHVFLVLFGPPGDGEMGAGSDTLFLSSDEGYHDLYATEPSPKPAFLFVPGIGIWQRDVVAGGTNDGEGAVGGKDGQRVFELRHPLRSGDVGRDIDASVGDTLPLLIRHQGPDGASHWPGLLPDERDSYATLRVFGDARRIQLGALRAILKKAPGKLFSAGLDPKGRATDLQGNLDPTEELRRENLIAGVVDSFHFYREGKTELSLGRLKEIQTRIDPGSPESWLNHDASPLGAALYGELLALQRVLELDLPTTCQSPPPGVRNGVQHFFEERFEGPTSDWTANGLWHKVANPVGDDVPNCRGGDKCFWYGSLPKANYETGGPNSGELESPPFFVPIGVPAILSFSTKSFTEDHFIRWDHRQVFVSRNGGSTYDPVPVYEDQRRGASWATAIADLRGYSGCVRLKFRFDTVDEKFNGTHLEEVDDELVLRNFYGWLVDDVIVYASGVDVEWTLLGAAPAGPAAPVLVGDEEIGTADAPGTGRLYAFTIDAVGVPHLTAHDMHRGFSAWSVFPASPPLVPGSASATSWNGRILVAARGSDGLAYTSFFDTVSRDLPSLAPFQAVGAVPIVGRPAVAVGPQRFHLVANGVPGNLGGALLHAQTSSLTGSWSAMTPVPGATPGLFDPTAAVAPDGDPAFGDVLHVVYADPSSFLAHVTKRDGLPFQGPASTNVLFNAAAPSIVWFHGRLHLAAQLAGTSLIYKHTLPDGTWGFSASAAPHMGTAAPRLVDFFGSPIIITRGQSPDGEAVEFFRVDKNLPGEPLAHAGFLTIDAAKPPFLTSDRVEAVRSYAEIYAAARSSGNGVPSYVSASRMLASRTFDELGIEVSGGAFPECRDVPGYFDPPRRHGDTPSNVGGECPGKRAPYPPSLAAIDRPWDHVAYSRLAALIWLFPWPLWGATDAAVDFEAHLRGLDRVARAAGGNGVWFGLGYHDLGGDMNSKIGPAAGPAYPSVGAVDQEFTHALYPIATLETDVFWDDDGDVLLCGQTRRDGDCPYPEYYAFASNYARSSEDHDFIETWRDYRLIWGNWLRQRASDGMCCGRPELQEKHDYIRDVIYGGQEFDRGKPCDSERCSAPVPCPSDPVELMELCER